RPPRGRRRRGPPGGLQRDLPARPGRPHAAGGAAQPAHRRPAHRARLRPRPPAGTRGGVGAMNTAALLTGAAGGVLAGTGAWVVLAAALSRPAAPVRRARRLADRGRVLRAAGA